MIDFENFEHPEKPEDWPQNRRESILSIIDDFCDDFIKDPSFKNKERLIALTTFDDPNHNYDFGLLRFTDYESGLINSLYFKFKLINFQYGINFLYDVLFQSAHSLKMLIMLPSYPKLELIDCYRGLIPQLKYFFMTSYFFFYNKQRSFADELINEIEIIEKGNTFSNEQIVGIFNNVLYDLSCKCTNHWFYEFNFTRIEIKKLFDKSSLLMKKASFKQTDRPHKGILCMSISNYVLKSRNNYDFTNIYKCVDKKTVDASFTNHELWMRKKSKLNDKREGKVIREVFSNRQWINYEWAKGMKFTYERESFTCSFSKIKPSEELKKKYGGYVYGYHNDVVGPSISTLIKVGDKAAKFSQFIVYDLLYSREEFKNEMNYLFSIIDGFNLNDEDKKFFLEDIIDYWKLTIKDKKWEKEHERRYEVMHFNDYEYVECSITEEFLKNKTPLLLYPDFLVGKNHRYDYLSLNVVEKARFQSLGTETYICKNCLFRSFTYNEDDGCKICGSKNIKILNKE